MDFIDALRVLGRRWRIVAVGIVAVISTSAAGIFLVPTNYQAAGQLLLLLPAQATGASSPTNPYLNLVPGLTVTASLIASTLTTKEAQRSVAESGFTSEYSVGINPGTGPLLEISAEDTDPVMAVKTRDEVIRRLQAELARIQAEEQAPQRQLIRIRPNSVPQQADPLPGSKIRALAVIGGLGITLTLVIAFGIDRVRRPDLRRQRELDDWRPATLPPPSAATTVMASAGVPVQVPTPAPEPVPAPAPAPVPAMAYVQQIEQAPRRENRRERVSAQVSWWDD